jgi:hypothetical protein
MNSEELVLLMKAENLNVKRVSTILSVRPVKGPPQILDAVWF